MHQLIIRKEAAFRVLMLHGFGQSGAEFEISTRRLRDALKSTLPHSELHDEICAFEYPTAPLALHDTYEAQVGKGRFAWWRRLDNIGEYTELSATLMYLKDYITNQGPFDGVVGFSQGATLAHMLASWCEASVSSRRRDALARQGRPLSSTPPQNPFRFSIGFAGWKGTEAYHGGFYDPAMETPTLFVRGQWDVNVPSRAPSELLNCSTRGQFLEHSGTHYVPRTRDLVASVANFVSRALALPSDQVHGCETANGSQESDVKREVPLYNSYPRGRTVYRCINRRRYNVVRKKFK